MPGVKAGVKAGVRAGVRAGMRAGRADQSLARASERSQV